MPQIPNEDLFEHTKMTFGEHLEELRLALFRAILGLVIGVIVGLCVANPVVSFVERPLRHALEAFYVNETTKELSERYGSVHLFTVQAPQDGVSDLDSGNLPPWLKQAFQNSFEPLTLKARIEVAAAGSTWHIYDEGKMFVVRKESGELNIYGSVPEELEQRVEENNLVYDDLYVERDELRRWFRLSLADDPAADLAPVTTHPVRGKVSDQPGQPSAEMILIRLWRPLDTQIKSLNAQEPFMIWVKAGVITGVTIASPWIFWQIWNFVAAGLYPHEKKYVHIFLPFSLGLFLAGAVLAFAFVFKPVLGFLFSFNARLNIDPDPRISEWMSFVLLLPLGFGVSFQLPLVMLFLERIGVMSVRSYLDRWRLSVLVIFFIAMILTPAEPISMLLMAIPLTVLFFGGIALCRWMPRRSSPFGEGYDP